VLFYTTSVAFTDFHCNLYTCGANSHAAMLKSADKSCNFFFCTNKNHKRKRKLRIAFTLHTSASSTCILFQYSTKSICTSGGQALKESEVLVTKSARGNTRIICGAAKKFHSSPPSPQLAATRTAAQQCVKKSRRGGQKRLSSSCAALLLFIHSGFPPDSLRPPGECIYS
jgi:hypothetical protein